MTDPFRVVEKQAFDRAPVHTERADAADDTYAPSAPRSVARSRAASVTRMRVILLLAVGSWAVVALVAWLLGAF